MTLYRSVTLADSNCYEQHRVCKDSNRSFKYIPIVPQRYAYTYTRKMFSIITSTMRTFRENHLLHKLAFGIHSLSRLSVFLLSLFLMLHVYLLFLHISLSLLSLSLFSCCIVTAASGTRTKLLLLQHDKSRSRTLPPYVICIRIQRWWWTAKQRDKERMNGRSVLQRQDESVWGGEGKKSEREKRGVEEKEREGDLLGLEGSSAKDHGTGRGNKAPFLCVYTVCVCIEHVRPTTSSREKITRNLPSACCLTVLTRALVEVPLSTIQFSESIRSSF